MQHYGQQASMSDAMPNPSIGRSSVMANGPMCSGPTKEPAVAVALGRLTQNVVDVSQLIEMLEGRLQPILRNDPESPNEQPAYCDGVVPLSQTITGSVVNLAKAKDRLASILNRLEL